jgi:Bacterial Ig-like domain (group 2)
MLHRVRSVALAAFGLVVLGLLAGCGSSNSTPVLAATLKSISISPPSVNIPRGTTQQFKAIGTFSDNSTKDITATCAWTSSNTALVTINAATGLAMAVNNATIGQSANISCSQSGVNATTAGVATVVAAVLSSIAVTANSASVDVGATDQFTATGHFTDGSTSNISNSVTWNPNCTPAGAATISNTGLAAGVATGSCNVTATQSSITSSPAFVLTVTAVSACGSGSEGLLSGQYAIQLLGFDNGKPAAIGAIFDADGKGDIAKLVGIMDINSAGSSLGPTPNLNLSIESANSSYSVGSDQRGCLTIVIPTAMAPLTLKFRISLGSISGGVASNGHIIEFDSVAVTAGVLRQQDTSVFNTGSFSGFSFVFGGSGGDGKFGVAGAFSTSGTSITTGELDTNNTGTLDSDSALTDYPATGISFTGSYSIASTGRGTFTENFGGGVSVNGILYPVSASELLSMSSDTQSSTSPLFAEEVLKQTNASFGLGDLNATSVVYTSGLGTIAGTTDTQLGLVTPNGTGGFSITLNENDGGALTSGTVTTGVYSVAANGRSLVSGVGKHNAALYLVGPNEGFIVSSGGKVSSGFLEPQSGSPFTNASAKSPPPYALGAIQLEDPTVDLDSGVDNFDGVGTITGTNDDNSTGSGGSLNPNGSINDTYSIDATGTGSIPAGCSFTAGTCDLIFIVISPTKAVLTDAKPLSGTSNADPSLRIADQ